MNTMMEEYPKTLDELIKDEELNPEKYNHIKIIMDRQINKHMEFGQFYLFVNDSGYAVYRLDNVDYENSIIRLSVTNTITGKEDEIYLDIHDKRPQLFLINWDNIKQMAYAESACNDTMDGLLELE